MTAKSLREIYDYDSQAEFDAAGGAAKYGGGLVKIGGSLYLASGGSLTPISGAGSGAGGSYASITTYGAAVGGFWDAALAAAVADLTGPTKNGGVLFFPAGVYAFANAFPTPVADGSTPPRSKPLILLGESNSYTNRSTNLTQGSVLDFQCSATYGKIALNNMIQFGLRDLTLTASANFTTPLFYSTNACVVFENVLFGGQSGTGQSCVQDAIVLGGPTQAEGSNNFTDGFQGYGSSIKNCFFRRIKSCIKGQAFFNAVPITGNTIWNDCGASDDTPAISIDCGTTGGSQVVTGNVIRDNLIEVTNYAYGIYFANAQGNVAENSFFDAELAKSKACYKLAVSAKNNRVGCTWQGSKTGGNGILPLADDDALWASQADTPTWLSGSSFSVPTDKTATYKPGRRIRITQTNGAASKLIIGTINTSVFSSVTTVTLTLIEGAASGSALVNPLTGAQLFLENYAPPSQPNYTKANAQGQYERVPPFISNDDNYPSKIGRLVINYSAGAKALKIKPEASVSIGVGVPVLAVEKADIDGGTAVLNVMYDGSLIFGDITAAIAPKFVGNQWIAQNAGQNLKINTGTGGSYFQVQAWGWQMQDYSSGSTVATILFPTSTASRTDVRFDKPVAHQSAALASLPTTNLQAGSTAFASNGRKSGEGAGAGTGIPVWWDGTNWKTFYDNSTAAA